jgi:hypothetical protein
VTILNIEDGFNVDVEDIRRLATHATHHGNCSLDSWSPNLARCQCGLFQLLKRLEKRGILKKYTKAELDKFPV